MRQQYVKRTIHGHPNADAQGHVLAHLLVATKALGRPLPVGVEVHHVDGDGTNNLPTNLVICQDRSYHKLLHVRARVLHVGGDPNTHRICSTCRQLKQFEAFNRRTGNKSDGLQRRCRECQKALYRDPRAEQA